MSSLQDDWTLYIHSLDEIFAEVDDLLRTIPTTTGEQRRQTIQQLNSQLVDAGNMIDSLKSLIPELHPERRQSGSQEIQELQDRLIHYRQRAQTSSRAIGDNDEMRQSLFGSQLRANAELGDLDGMEKLRSNTSALSEGIDILDNTLQVATDTEGTALGTIEELGRHSEVLHSIDTHNRDISGDLGQGAGFLRRMQIRAKQNAFILVMIIIVIIALIALILFFIIKNRIDKKKKSL